MLTTWFGPQDTLGPGFAPFLNGSSPSLRHDRFEGASLAAYSRRLAIADTDNLTADFELTGLASSIFPSDLIEPWNYDCFCTVDVLADMASPNLWTRPYE